MHKVMIPEIGQKFVLVEPWTLNLKYISKNSKILTELKCFDLLHYKAYLHIMQISSNVSGFQALSPAFSETMISLLDFSFDITLSPGTVLTLDSINVTRTKKVISLNLIKTPDFKKTGRVKFITHLSDFNNIKFKFDK